MSGNHTIGLFQSLNANPRMLQTALAYPDVISPSLFCTDKTQIGFRRPDCTKTRVRERANTAFSIYNGLEFKATTRNFHNLTSTFAYTFSRAIDNSSDVFSTFTGGNSLTFAQNPFDPNVSERGVSGNSIPHVASASFVYDFPMFKTQSGLMGKLLGGFQMNGIWTFDTGQPVTPYCARLRATVRRKRPGCNPGLSNYCDGQFSVVLQSSVSTCRPVLSNKRAPAQATGIYLNPDSGDFWGVPAGYYTLSSFLDYLFGGPDLPDRHLSGPGTVALEQHRHRRCHGNPVPGCWPQYPPRQPLEQSQRQHLQEHQIPRALQPAASVQRL